MQQVVSDSLLTCSFMEAPDSITWSSARFILGKAGLTEHWNDRFWAQSGHAEPRDESRLLGVKRIAATTAIV
jgi:hypothetical protein